MKSYFDRPRSTRRVTREESADVKRQREEKDGRPRQEPAEEKTDVITQIRTGLNRIERKLDKLVQEIEERLWPNELREDSRENKAINSDVEELFVDLKRIEAKVTKHSEIEERLMKRYIQQCSERKKLERVLDEVRMERDVLLEKIHTYLEQICSLKSKVEEQRCSIGAYERQVNAEYEVHLRKLESMNEDLRVSAVQKEKQLKDANEQLRQMQMMLRSYEMLSWRKKNEESVFIAILKNDLQTIWNDKIKMEEEFKRLKKKCGYTEDDNRWKVCSEECMGSLLRRSKSMSDFTLAISSAEVEDCRKEISATTSNAPSRYSKDSQVEDISVDSFDSSSASRQKLQEATVELTEEVKNSEEKRKTDLTNPENVTKDC